MKDRPVTITLHSRQQTDGVCQVLRRELEGILHREADGFTLTYRETDSLGSGPAETAVCFSGKGALLRRRGAASMEMRFCSGEARPCACATPWGTLELLTETEGVRWRLEERSGSAMIRYRLRQGETPAGEFTLKYYIKEKDEVI